MKRPDFAVLNEGNTSFCMICQCLDECLCSHEVISDEIVNSDETVRQTRIVNRFLLNMETKSTSVLCCTAAFVMSTFACLSGSYHRLFHELRSQFHTRWSEAFLH